MISQFPDEYVGTLINLAFACTARCGKQIAGQRGTQQRI